VNFFHCSGSRSLYISLRKADANCLRRSAGCTPSLPLRFAGTAGDSLDEAFACIAPISPGTRFNRRNHVAPLHRTLHASSASSPRESCEICTLARLVATRRRKIVKANTRVFAARSAHPQISHPSPPKRSSAMMTLDRLRSASRVDYREEEPRAPLLARELGKRKTRFITALISHDFQRRKRANRLSRASPRNGRFLEAIDRVIALRTSGSRVPGRFRRDVHPPSRPPACTHVAATAAVQRGPLANPLASGS